MMKTLNSDESVHLEVGPCPLVPNRILIPIDDALIEVLWHTCRQLLTKP